jgi:hypothetical protein
LTTAGPLLVGLIPIPLTLLTLDRQTLLLLSIDDIIVNSSAVIEVDIEIVHVLPIDRQGRQARHGAGEGGLGRQGEEPWSADAAEGQASYGLTPSLLSLGRAAISIPVRVSISLSSSPTRGNLLDGQLVRLVFIFRFGGILLIRQVLR